jgi:hypothetical protein
MSVDVSGLVKQIAGILNVSPAEPISAEIDGISSVAGILDEISWWEYALCFGPTTAGYWQFVFRVLQREQVGFARSHLTFDFSH